MQGDFSLGAERVSVKPAKLGDELPSTTNASSIRTEGGGSSSIIVPVPCPLTTDGPVALLSKTLKFSLNSSILSPITATVRLWLVTRGPNVSVPENQRHW